MKILHNLWNETDLENSGHFTSIFVVLLSTHKVSMRLDNIDSQYMSLLLIIIIQLNRIDCKENPLMYLFNSRSFGILFNR